MSIPFKNRIVWAMGLSALVVFSMAPRVHAAASWWDANYALRKQITVTASTDALGAGYSVSFAFDHAALVTAGKSLSSGDDVRIVYWNGTSNTEIDRVCDVSSSWNNAATKIWLKLQAGISASGSDDGYWMYYNYASAGSAPATGTNVFLLWDDFLGASLDATLWHDENTFAGTLTVGSGQLTINSPGRDWWGSSDGSRYICSKTSLTANYLVESYVVRNGGSGYNRFFALRSGLATSAKMFVMLTDIDGSYIPTVWRDEDSGGTTLQPDAWAANPGGNKIAKFIRSGDTATAYYDGSLLHTRTVPDWNLSYVALTDSGLIGGDTDTCFDWVRARLYVASDASISSSAGAEQRQKTESGTIILLR